MKLHSFSVILLAIIWVATPVFALNSEDRPVGWDEMTTEEQGAFLELLNGFVVQQGELQLDPQEYSQLSKTEKRELNISMKQLEVDYKTALDGGGYELKRSVAAKVKKLSKGSKAPLKGIAGTITYDTGTPFGGGDNAPNSNMVGNRFDTSLGNPVEMSGTISRLTFYMESVGGSAAFLSVFDQQFGTAANPVDSVSVPGLAAGTFNTHTFGTPYDYAGGTFLAGVWRFNSDLVGVDSGTVGGQGHHGVFINDIVGTGFADLETGMGAGLNAMVRASGGNLIPVELMKFEVETEKKSGSEAEGAPQE